MRVAIAIAVLLTLASYGWAHGGGYVPPPDPPRIPPPDPPRVPPPPPPGPPPPPTYDPSQPPVTTPTPEPFTPNPTTPGESPLRPWAREPVRKPVRTRPTGGTENTWRTWWELNREHLVGLRTIVRAGGPVTGDGRAARDPLGERRAEVLAALRKLALRASEEDLRAAALIALGRMGDDQDARLFLRLLHDRGEDEAVQEAAAVGLGLLPPVGDAATVEALRAFVDYAVRHPRVLPTRARGLLLLAAGLRGGDDPILVATLVARSTGPGGGSDEAANLAYAFGLSGDVLVVPEICQAVRKGALGAEDLGDIGRAHAASALARVGDPNAARLLAAVLDSRRAGIQSRRSAALALGKLLRESAMDEAQVARARAALLRAFDKDSDPVLRGFAAVALGGAREPLGVPELMKAIDHGGNAEIKPFCGLALGLAARTLGEDQGRRIRSFLVAELDKTNAVELASALSVALGLAHAREASDVLLGRVLRPSLPAASRGAAAQGLGLMRSATPEVTEALEKLALTGDSPDLVEDVVLALGLLGRRGVAADLAMLLRKSGSTRLQARIALAMVHLDHSAAVAPLLELMEDERAQAIVREFAAVALGIMGDRRAGDRLFETDAWFNYFATTKATNEFVRLY